MGAHRSVWTRLNMPNGRSIVLERQPGADAEGYAGLKDEVDNHWGTLFKAAILSTLLSIGSEVGTSGTEDELLRAIRRGGADSVNQIGQRVVGWSLNVQPTITIRPGFPVRVLVTRDLVLDPIASEETVMSKLKLAATEDDKPVRLTVEVPAAVHRDLAMYAEALGQGASKAVDPGKLIPPMLARFMATDRAFAKLRRTKSKQPA